MLTSHLMARIQNSARVRGMQSVFFSAPLICAHKHNCEYATYRCVRSAQYVLKLLKYTCYAKLPLHSNVDQTAFKWHIKTIIFVLTPMASEGSTYSFQTASHLPSRSCIYCIGAFKFKEGKMKVNPARSINTEIASTCA
jgi:hypothetical protein